MHNSNHWSTDPAMVLNGATDPVTVFDGGSRTKPWHVTNNKSQYRMQCIRILSTEPRLFISIGFGRSSTVYTPELVSPALRGQARSASKGSLHQGLDHHLGVLPRH